MSRVLAELPGKATGLVHAAESIPAVRWVYGAYFPQLTALRTMDKASHIFAMKHSRLGLVMLTTFAASRTLSE